MINKTIRQNKELAIGIAEVTELNPRITKESEAITYAYHLVASELRAKEYTINWKETGLLDFGDTDKNLQFVETRSASVENEDWDIVLESYISQTNQQRVMFSYLTRLVLLHARKTLRERMNKVEESQEIEVVKVEGVSLIRRLAELLESDTEVAQKKIAEIKKIIEEDSKL